MRGQCASSGFPNLRDRHILPETRLRKEVAPQSVRGNRRVPKNMTRFHGRPTEPAGPPQSTAGHNAPRGNNETGGPERDQTADLVVANDALYQLSYRPEKKLWYWEIAARK